MIRSVYKQLIAEGYLGRIDSLFNTKHWKGTGFDLSFYEYDILFKKYVGLFGMDNVYFLAYENMKSDIYTFLKDMCNCLSIFYSEIEPELCKRIVNKGMSNSGLSIIRFLNHFRKSELNPNPLFTINKLYSLLRKILGRFPSAREILSDETIQHIRSYYLESNSRLIEMVDTDLSLYMERFNCSGGHTS